MNISLIITTKNESRTISKLLDSIANQTRIPDEVIITDENPSQYERLTDRYALKFKLRIMPIQPGANRAVGRNTAIRAAAYEHILITDAGCVLKSDWVEQMMTGFETASVVAGFYAGVAKTLLETCQIPYVLVMPDRLDTKSFLPATRSMGITQSLFVKLGGFDEQHRYAEDYEFARRIRAQQIPIVVVPNAIVYWRPRPTLFSFARMIYEHACGDAIARSFRPKVATIYLRYILFLLLLGWNLQIALAYLFLYLLYSVYKNYRYVRHWKACLYLPLLQIVSDFAVMIGTAYGLLA